ncbi:hypothetical protein [Nostoc sp.]|uniref:hypothetical protein n=1 Tax=Nostoc sp. TaxID=1180 RepID=UPI002FF8AF81
MNEKGARAIANRFAICPHDYQQRVEQGFGLLAAAAKSISEAIEDDLNQWFRGCL